MINLLFYSILIMELYLVPPWAELSCSALFFKYKLNDFGKAYDKLVNGGCTDNTDFLYLFEEKNV